MAEPLAEQIAAAIRSSIASIVSDAGVTYWYTPDAVIRAQFEQRINYDEFKNHVVIVRPGEMSERLRTTRGGYDCTLELYVEALRKDENLSSNPAQQDPVAETVQHRMLEDIKRRLRADVIGWGLGITAIEFPMADKTAYIAGRVVVHLLILIQFSGRRT